MSLRDDLRKSAKAAVWRQRPEILLGPQIPKPMHGLAPRNILGRQWWNETRRKAYESTDYHCIACGIWRHKAQGPGWLEGHEIYKIDYRRGRMVYVETVPLCHYCHSYIHRGRLEALLEAGDITHQRYVAVVQHGDRVLKEAGLSPTPLYSGPVADWGKWRLVLNGKRYPPIYQTAYDWIQSHTLSQGE